MENFKITVVGGGTGTFTVLRGLKRYPVDLRAVIGVADSGGSTGRLRSEFGFLPVGDLRQGLAALANDDNETLLKLLTYRFDRGRELKGHNLGNLVLTALRDIYGTEPRALEKAASVFRISGRVYPVSLEKTNLGAIYTDGRKVLGEHQIDQPKFVGGVRIRNLFLKPKVKAYRKAIDAIRDSDLVVLGPGDLYTSTLPCLLVTGVAPALRKTGAKLVYVVNLLNRFSQAHNFKASDYVLEIEKYGGRRPDFILLNTAKVPQAFLPLYLREKATPVINDLQASGKMAVVAGDFLLRTPPLRVQGDNLPRSFLRHDSDKLARALIKILL